ncbi:MAG: hypothetical protein K2N30_03825 [Clostridia bacterium]|nr:hypothetical protein [Clostridia bacterium]
MKKNVIASTLSGSSKIFLLVCLASAFVADLAVFVMLLVQDVSASYWIFPLFFLLADALFIAQAAFSNFRFAYTVWQIVIWCVLTAVMLICTVVLNISGNVTVFTNVAAALIIALHAAALLAVITCYVYASRSVAGGRTAQTAVAVLATVISVALVAFYGAFLGFGGFFGQGFGLRPVSYIYNEETDGYEAVATVGTKGDTVVVPEEFNGKKVTAVSAKIFTEAGVQNVYLECSADAKIDLNVNGISAINEGLKIYTSKEDIDLFKNQFYEYKRDGYLAGLALANAMVPYGLDDGEVYVTFAYDTLSFTQAEQKPLPTWFGKKGQSIDNSYFKDIPYAMHSDRLDDGDLYWCYNNTEEKVILSDFTADGNIIGAVTESATATVGFEKVYRVFPGESNDLLHSADVEFDFSVIDGLKADYKLTTAKNADKVIAPYKRDGFSLEWNYTAGNQSVEFTSLSEALQSATLNSLYINPVWSVNAPVLNLSSDCADNTVVYGGDITLTAEAAAPAAGFKLDYEWRSSFSDRLDCDTAVYKREMIRRTEAGYYTVSVTASTAASSLTAEVYRVIEVAVARRPVTVEWDIPQNVVYDGNTHKVSCSIKTGDVLTFDGVRDSVGLTNSEFIKLNAGIYSLETGLDGADSDNYIISDGSHAKSFTISQKGISVNIAIMQTSKYYDGSFEQGTDYNYSVEGVIGNDNIQLFIEGRSESAGSHRLGCHLAAGSPQSNYYIEYCNNPTYEILKQPLTLEWSVAGGDGFTYDGAGHLVTVTATRTQGKYAGQTITECVSPLPAYLTDAGRQTVNTYVRDGNYEVVSGYETHTFTVNKRTVSEVKRSWAEQVLTYNGNEQAPYFVIEGVGRDEGETIYVDGAGGVHAGTHTFAPTGINGGYANNYQLASNVTGDFGFTINPARVFIEWTNSFVYDGKAHAAVAEAYGLGLDGLLNISVTVSGDKLTDGKAINVGTYTAAARLLDGGSGKYLATDYELINPEISMSVTRATITVTADSKTVFANQPFTLTYTVTGLVNGETAASVGLKVSSIFVSGHQGVSSLSAGVYTIIVSGTQVLDNYYVNYATGILTVIGGK